MTRLHITGNKKDNELMAKPTVEMAINGMNYVLDDVPLPYSTVCALARKPGQQLTVTYKRPDGTGGSLSDGESLAPVEGTVINAVHTGSA